MTSRRFQEQTGLFPTFQPDRQAIEIERIRHEAMRARDEALAAGLARLVRTIGRTLAVIGTAIMTWPQRRSTYENLRSLIDRELADIGLTRGDIARVFEPEFRLNTRSVANTNQPKAATQAA